MIEGFCVVRFFCEVSVFIHIRGNGIPSLSLSLRQWLRCATVVYECVKRQHPNAIFFSQRCSAMIVLVSIMYFVCIYALKCGCVLLAIGVSAVEFVWCDVGGVGSDTSEMPLYSAI